MKEVNLMKVKAFVLVETAPSKSNAVTAVLKQLEGVKTANLVTGPYDVIAIVEGETLNDVGGLVTGKIHSIEGITRTVICLAV